MSQEKLPVDTKTACVLLHCSLPTLHKWIKAGTVQSMKLPGERLEVWLPVELLQKSAKV